MTRGASRVLYDSRDTHLNAIFFIHTSIGNALSDNDIVEQTNRIKLANFSNLQCYACD